MSFGDPGIEREAEHIVGGFLGIRKAASEVVHEIEGAVEMDGDLVVDSDPDSGVMHPRKNPVPVGQAYRIDMLDGFVFGQDLWQLDAIAIGQQCVVVAGGLAALIVPGRKSLELGIRHRGVQSIET